MKVLLYFENEKMLKTSGIGRAMKHQKEALESQGIAYTTDADAKDYDVLHVNTYMINSSRLIAKAKKDGKKVIVHAHSTEEDFRDSFILSNQLSPIFKKIIMNVYSQGDYILTPTPYSKKILQSYGLQQPIEDISNGIDIQRFDYNEEKVKAFRKYFSLKEDDKVVIGVGLYFERKGILDFVKVAEALPEYKFIWFGYTPLYSIPKHIREVIQEKHPKNVLFPGYVKGAIIEGAFSGCNAFFFPSNEETEGIVVLEALASRQNVVVRDIPVYEPWLEDKVNCYKGSNNEEFQQLIKGVVEETLPSTREAGRKTAEARSIDQIGVQLKNIYKKVLE